MSILRSVVLYFVVLGLCGAIACKASPAFAEDWEFTKWGMTVDEVVAASGGKAMSCKDEACRGERGYTWTKLWMPMKYNGFDMIVSFNFDRETNLLTDVLLMPKDKVDYDRMLREARLKYKREIGPWKESLVLWTTTWAWKWGDGEIWLQAFKELNPQTASLTFISREGLKKLQSAL